MLWVDDAQHVGMKEENENDTRAIENFRRNDYILLLI